MNDKICLRLRKRRFTSSRHNTKHGFGLIGQVIEKNKTVTVAKAELETTTTTRLKLEQVARNIEVIRSDTRRYAFIPVGTLLYP